MKVLWCSGYHICFTRRRSPVRSRAEPLFVFTNKELKSKCSVRFSEGSEELSLFLIFVFNIYTYINSIPALRAVFASSRATRRCMTDDNEKKSQTRRGDVKFCEFKGNGNLETCICFDLCLKLISLGDAQLLQSECQRRARYINCPSEKYHLFLLNQILINNARN